MKRFAVLAALLATSSVMAAATLEIDTLQKSGTKEGTCSFTLTFYKEPTFTTEEDQTIKTMTVASAPINTCFVPTRFDASDGSTAKMTTHSVKVKSCTKDTVEFWVYKDTTCTFLSVGIDSS